jgi:hypothetical protein
MIAGILLLFSEHRLITALKLASASASTLIRRSAMCCQLTVITTCQRSIALTISLSARNIAISSFANITLLTTTPVFSFALALHNNGC